MTHLQVIHLSEEAVFSCPHCAVIHTRGQMLVEIRHEGQTFVFAELMSCCSDPAPVPVLFGSYAPARQVLDRIAESIRLNTTPFFELPLVSKKAFFS